MSLRCNIFMGHNSACYILFYVNQQPQCFNLPAPTAPYLLYMKQETTLLSQLQAGKHTNWRRHTHKPAGVRVRVHACTHTAIVIAFLWQAGRGRQSHIKIPLHHSASLLQRQPPPGSLSAPTIPRLSSSSRKGKINLAMVISACIKRESMHR